MLLWATPTLVSDWFGRKSREPIQWRSCTPAALVLLKALCKLFSSVPQKNILAMKVEGSFIDNCRIGLHPLFEYSKICKKCHLVLGFSRVDSLTAEIASDTAIYICGPKFYGGGANTNCPWVMFGISNHASGRQTLCLGSQDPFPRNMKCS